MRKISEILKNQYGEKVYKLSLSSGCTCPNRDGTAGYGGCAFCSEGGSGEYASSARDIMAQMEEAKLRIRKKTDAGRFIAYFQSFTNTYGDVKRLTELYERVISLPEIVILSIGTRPDCLGEDVMRMLIHLNAIKPVWVELGLQTIHDKTADRMNRGYALPVFREAVRKLKAAGIQVVVHVILGLPGETKHMMLQTIHYLAEIDPPIDGIKIQMLNILKDTRLAEEYNRQPFPLLTMDEYTDLVCESFQVLPDDIAVHRMTGDGPGDLLIAPDWVRNKKKVLNTITGKLTGKEGHGLIMELYKGRPDHTDGRLEREIRTYDYLDRLNIPYDRTDHEPATNMVACEEIDKVLGVLMCKNLFLCNRQKTRFYLLLMPGDKKFKTKELSSQIGSARLSFAGEEDMLKYLDIEPGAVSVMGLMNDKDREVQLLIDRDIMSEEYIGCHPCVCTSSMKIRTKDIIDRFLPATGHDYQTVTLVGE